MKTSIGSDHAGFQYKDKIRELLESLGHSVTDFGTHSEEPASQDIPSTATALVLWTAEDSSLW